MPDNTGSMVPFTDIDLDEISAKLIRYLRKELNLESVDYLEPLTRLTGGYETLICRFALNNVPENQLKPLILRIFAENSDIYQAPKESIVQNAMADLGYPVPKVHGTCIDKTILGNAFIIMDYVEGTTLFESNLLDDQIFDILGNLHAKLHTIDPGPIISKYTELGVDGRALTIDNRIEWLRTEANSNFPRLKVVVEWLFENRPNDPEFLNICHGDFHPLNILYGDGKVKAILDWGGFLFGDPALDVAWTTFLITVPARIVFPDIDPENAKEKYLNAYRKTRSLDETNMAYYSTIRSVSALVEGAQGQDVWDSPSMVKLLLSSIYEVTGIKIELP